MDKYAILAVMTAKPGKEKDVEAFLKSAQPMALMEPETSNWYAVRLGTSEFGIFDTFRDESGRDAHLKGQVAKALFAQAEDLFSAPPTVEKLDIIASMSH
jgi:quinol monooxygenase YgiN